MPQQFTDVKKEQLERNRNIFVTFSKEKTFA